LDGPIDPWGLISTTLRTTGLDNRTIGLNGIPERSSDIRCSTCVPNQETASQSVIYKTIRNAIPRNRNAIPHVLGFFNHPDGIQFLEGGCRRFLVRGRLFFNSFTCCGGGGALVGKSKI